MVFAFELKLLEVLGLAPDAAESRLSVDARQLVTALTETDWEGLSKLRATAAQAEVIKQFLHGFLIYHLGGFRRGERTQWI